MRNLKVSLLICKSYLSNIEYHFWNILIYSISDIDNQLDFIILDWYRPNV